MALFNTLSDSFQASSLSNLWSAFTAGGATFTYSSSGAQCNYPAATSSSTDGDITTTGQFDLTGNRIRFQVLSVATGSTSTDHTFRLLASGSAANAVQFQWEAGQLYAQKVVASSQTNLTNVTYNSTTHRWWSLREQSGTTYWETSSDGINWNLLFSVANPVTVTSMTCNIAGTSFGVDTNNLPFIWNNLNFDPIHSPNHFSVGDGMSRSEVAN